MRNLQQNEIDALKQAANVLAAHIHSLNGAGWKYSRTNALILEMLNASDALSRAWDNHLSKPKTTHDSKDLAQ